MHSMRVAERDLNPWIICSPGGRIESCHCDCVAGLGEACSHVGALLFHAEFIQRKKNDASVTDVPAYWKRGSKKVVSPQKMSAIPFVNAKTAYVKPKPSFKKPIKINRTLPEKVEVRVKPRLIQFHGEFHENLERVKFINQSFSLDSFFNLNVEVRS